MRQQKIQISKKTRTYKKQHDHEYAQLAYPARRSTRQHSSTLDLLENASWSILEKSFMSCLSRGAYRQS